MWSLAAFIVGNDCTAPEADVALLEVQFTLRVITAPTPKDEKMHTAIATITVIITPPPMLCIRLNYLEKSSLRGKKEGEVCKSHVR